MFACARAHAVHHVFPSVRYSPTTPPTSIPSPPPTPFVLNYPSSLSTSFSTIPSEQLARKRVACRMFNTPILEGSVLKGRGGRKGGREEMRACVLLPLLTPRPLLPLTTPTTAWSCSIFRTPLECSHSHLDKRQEKPFCSCLRCCICVSRGGWAVKDVEKLSTIAPNSVKNSLTLAPLQPLHPYLPYTPKIKIATCVISK